MQANGRLYKVAPAWNAEMEQAELVTNKGRGRKHIYS